MTRWRGIAIAVALALFLVAVVGLSRGRGDGRSDGDRREAAHADARGRAGRGGGVAARPVDSGAAVVHGTVVDEDGMPVDHGRLVLSCLSAGGSVRRIEGGTVSIGEDGAFEGPGCRDEVCAELIHPYWVRAEAWILRPATPSTLVARRLGRFVGEVADPGGQPVAAATVTFTRPVGEGHDETSALPLMTTTTTTDADGRFSAAWIERPPCDPCQEAAGGCAVADLRTADAFVLSVRAPGHGPAQQTLAVEDAEGFDDDAPLRIVLPHSADIASGRLVDEAGHGYPRAYVLARSTERPAEQRRADVAGENFELDGLGDGPYDLRAIQDGVVLAEATGVVAGQDVTMTGRPRADGPDVVLTVVDDEGRPVRARIDGGPFRDAATGDDGKVTATRVLPGDVALRIRIVGGEPFVHTISIPAPTPSDPEPARVPVRVRVAAPG